MNTQFTLTKPSGLPPREAEVELPASLVESGVGLSHQTDGFRAGREAATRAQAQTQNYQGALALVFASTQQNASEVLRGVNEVLPAVPVIGASTAGELHNGLHTGGVEVVLIASPYLKVQCVVGRHVSQNWRAAVQQVTNAPALKGFFMPGSKRWRELNLAGKSVFGILFTPGNTSATDAVTGEIVEELNRQSGGQLTLFGGAAADDWKMAGNHVFCGREAHPDALMLAVVETRLRFGISIGHGFEPLPKRAVVTRVEGHEVLELDQQPAAEVLAGMLDKTVRELRTEHVTLTSGRPIGVGPAHRVEKVVVASYLTERNGVRVSQPVRVGETVTVMSAEPVGIVNTGRDAITRAKLAGGIGQPAVVLSSYCALRPRILCDAAQAEVAKMVAALDGVPLAGFCSFGEVGVDVDGITKHQNVAVAALVLGTEMSQIAHNALENEKLHRAHDRDMAMIHGINFQLRGEIADRQRAENELLKLQRSLEERVRERTAALSATNVQLQKEMEERQRAEAMLRMQAAMLEAAANGVMITDAAGVVLWVNPAFVKLTGYSVAEVVGQKPGLLKSGKQDRRFYEQLWNTITAGNVWHGQLINRKKDGSLYTEELTITPVRLGAAVISHYIAIKQDVTERERMEEQLRQARKMEAVGQLAGGVAHDFNNILTAIAGYTELAIQRLPAGDGIRPNLEEVSRAAERATLLTRQLLAFSRKQVVELKVINLNRVVTNLGKMLQRLIGEHIELVFVNGADGDCHVKADAGQLDQILINMAVNARDAMPNGGRLTIATAVQTLDEAVAGGKDVHPGRYVVVSVADTGSGISDEIKTRIFEPFFTTKDPGKGTGLGLATCYSIAKQHSGYIEFESQCGKGTTFRIGLPQETPPVEGNGEALAAAKTVRGTETIFIVEDEPVLRELARIVLEEFGYTVLTSENGREAWALFQAGKVEECRLLVTDVVMPHMGGRELAEKMCASRPTLKVIFCSGYADDMIDLQGKLPSGSAFLQKPYTPSTLAAKVREVLDEGATS